MEFEPVTGRLREVRVTTRPTADGRSSVTFRNFVVEMPYSRDLNLNIGALLALETIKSDTYLILEVADYVPVHYGMINMDGSIPKEIRDQVMEEVSKSWRDGNSSEMWIDVFAYPIGYIATPEGFKKGYLPPLPGSPVRILNRESFREFVCARSGVEIGKVIGEDIPLTIDISKAMVYHMGVFAFTGSGKSNLTATLIRRILNHTNAKVVIFDVSMEYSILLLDQLLSQRAEILTTDRYPSTPLDASRRFMRTHVIPEDLERHRENIRRKVEELFASGKIRNLYIPPQGSMGLTFETLLELVRAQIDDKYTAFAQKPLFSLMLRKLDTFMRENKIPKDAPLDDSILSILKDMENEGRNAGLKENSSLFSFISSLRSYINTEVKESEEYDVEKLAIDILDRDESSPRLFILELQNLEESREVVASLLEEVMSRRKRSFSTSPVLFVLDEAQEFIPFDTRQRDKSELSSNAVEKLLRHGRKYHLHALISTQRLAYLNTNVLQQLHTYFISVLPRPYDRQLVSETFGINDTLLDRTLDLEVGQWLLVSFKASLPHDVPVFFSAPNNLEEVRRALEENRSANPVNDK
ncbi:ATP-binding protein [Metallosphaera javensis (ex Sakai et al. 2022)]|uniref:ATP-binding protein n=1 Tax=Metallosphaera javensis (ex Sakai et al. 2022) TaxID=2775498 RepID=UPI00258B4E3B|nr:MAG: DNA double-strand break repair helicase HerA [Metallosphaera javensis (ex Sakai et al. 2022)]